MMTPIMYSQAVFVIIMGTTREIAEFTHDTSFNDFDSGLVKHVKNVLLSGVGMTMAGVSTPTGKIVIDYVKQCAGPEEAGVLGAGFRTSAEYAALVNGTTSHSTELEDDTFPDAIYSVGLFPGIFALGEKLQVSGKEIIEALVIAWDIAGMLTLPARQRRKPGMIPSFCTLGIAAASAKMLKFGVEKTMMALSVAASHSSWLIGGQTGTGAHLYNSGLAGRNGIASAILVKHGLTGHQSILEAPMGYLQGVTGEAYSIPKLGEPYRAHSIGIKQYPCCYLEMHPMNAVIELIETHSISADDVESVQFDVSPVFNSYVRFQHPKNEEEARFSLPHSIAVCFLDGKPWLESYTAERVNDPQIRAFRDKVKLVVHPEWDTWDSWLKEIPLTLRLNNGTEYKKLTPKPTQPPPVSDDEVMDKYMKCVQPVLRESRAEEIAGLVRSLEKVQDISELMSLCTYPDK
jgi:2-methylcitrate dehydratase PrpD